MNDVNENEFEYSAEDLLNVDIPPIGSARMYRLPPYLFGRINALKMMLRQRGVDIIDLGMGNPSDPTPQPIVDKLCEAANQRRNQRYSAARGIFNLRRELAYFYEQEWGVGLDPQTEVIATIGSKEGFSHLCLATLGPGDVALTPTPAFLPTACTHDASPARRSVGMARESSPPSASGRARIEPVIESTAKQELGSLHHCKLAEL